MPFAVSSPNFSLAEQVTPPWAGCHSISGDAGREARAWYAQTQMPIFAWSSLAGGFFSGRFRRDNLDSFTDYFDTLCATTYGVEANFARLERAQTLAETKGLTLPQIALTYVLSYPLNLLALVGCRTGAEFRANAEACTVTLTPSELTWLEKG
jgi:aryl-alcohol dehydrogenase-like predicted oxidoreductase